MKKYFYKLKNKSYVAIQVFLSVTFLLGSFAYGAKKMNKFESIQESTSSWSQSFQKKYGFEIMLNIYPEQLSPEDNKKPVEKKTLDGLESWMKVIMSTIDKVAADKTKLATLKEKLQMVVMMSFAPDEPLSDNMFRTGNSVMISRSVKSIAKGPPADFPKELEEMMLATFKK